MLNLCGIVVTILKMATGRNFSMSGINSGHHYLPTYQIDDIGQCWIFAVLQSGSHAQIPYLQQCKVKSRNQGT
jgi:hypothetical protein